jgi:hypothetical protein
MKISHTGLKRNMESFAKGNVNMIEMYKLSFHWRKTHFEDGSEKTIGTGIRQRDLLKLTLIRQTCSSVGNSLGENSRCSKFRHY